MKGRYSTTQRPLGVLDIPSHLIEAPGRAKLCLTVSFAVLLACSGLAGCAGGYGSGESAATDGSSYKADSPGQQLLLEATQQRRAMESTTQAPDVPVPASAAPSKCEGFPGFDRGCPVGTK
jgi:hypothetical protein